MFIAWITMTTAFTLLQYAVLCVFYHHIGCTRVRGGDHSGWALYIVHCALCIVHCALCTSNWWYTCKGRRPLRWGRKQHILPLRYHSTTTNAVLQYFSIATVTVFQYFSTATMALINMQKCTITTQDYSFWSNVHSNTTDPPHHYRVLQLVFTKHFGKPLSTGIVSTAGVCS